MLLLPQKFILITLFLITSLYGADSQRSDRQINPFSSLPPEVNYKIIQSMNPTRLSTIVYNSEWKIDPATMTFFFRTNLFPYDHSYLIPEERFLRKNMDKATIWKNVVPIYNDNWGHFKKYLECASDWNSDIFLRLEIKMLKEGICHLFLNYYCYSKNKISYVHLRDSRKFMSSGPITVEEEDDYSFKWLVDVHNSEKTDWVEGDWSKYLTNERKQGKFLMGARKDKHGSLPVDFVLKYFLEYMKKLSYIELSEVGDFTLFNLIP